MNATLPSHAVGMLFDKWLVLVQRKGHTWHTASPNTATPRTPKQPQESKLNCPLQFLPYCAIVKYVVSECKQDVVLASCALRESSEMRWGNSHCAVCTCMCGEGQNVRQTVMFWFLQQSICRSNCLATDRHVRSLALNQHSCLWYVKSSGVTCHCGCILRTLT